MYRHRLQKSRVNPTFALACAAVNNCHVPIGNMRFTSEAELLKIQKCFLGENLEQFIFFAVYLTSMWCRLFGPVVGTVTSKAIAPAHRAAMRAVLGNAGAAGRPRTTVRAARPKRSGPVGLWHAV